MKKLLSILAAVSAIVFAACEKMPTENAKVDLSEKVELCFADGVTSSRLKFGSTNAIIAQLEYLKDNKKVTLPTTGLTRAEGGDNDTTFTSLRAALEAQGLQGLTDEDLAYIKAEELEYEPEDSIVWDPYMCAILNTDREVQVEDDIYRIVKDGYVIYDANAGCEYVENILETVDTSALTPNTETLLAEGIRFGYYPVEVVEVDNRDLRPDVQPIDSLLLNDPDNGLILKPDPEPKPEQPISEEEYYSNYPAHIAKSALNASGNLVLLSDNVTIPNSDIVSCQYKSKSHESSGFLSRIFGHSTVINNYFDSKHRMRLRMYSQNYGIWAASGMTVRMQKKFIGWWRCPADEFKYGWSGIELVSKFSKQPFTGSMIPDYVRIKFEVEDKPIVFFNIPQNKYNYANGNTTALYRNYINNTVQTIIRKYEAEASAVEKSSSFGEYGVYAVDKNDNNKLRFILPQGEKTAYDKGREVEKFDFQFLPYGIYIYYSLGNGNGFGNHKLDLPNISITTLDRGMVYAAVKYKGKWKAAYITTGN